MIIPLSRDFRQKSNAFQRAKTKVATGKAAGSDEERERDVEKGKKVRGGGKIVEAEERKRRISRGREREKKERGRKRERSSMSNSALDRTAHHPFPVLIYRRYPSTLRALVRALAHRPSLYSRAYTYSPTQACTESRSHPPAARGPARPTPSRQPSLGRRVPALSVFPRPVPTTPFHAVSRRACPYTPPACNCPLYRL